MIDGAMQRYALTLDKFLDHAAKWHPDVEVVSAHPDGVLERVGYADIKERAQRLSQVLVDRGIGLGDRVATLVWNSQAHVEAWYGIMGIGAACHTLNPRLTVEQTASILAQSEARILIVSADLVPLARQIVAHTPLQHMLVVDGEADLDAVRTEGVSITAMAPLIAAASNDIAWGGFDETTASGLCFTSGTTGAPKGVSYTHRSSYLHTSRLLQADVIGITAADTVLAMVPMFHANAWGLPFAAPAVGAKLVLPGRLADGASLAKLINSEGVTVAAGVPTVWLGLVEHLEACGGEVPTLKRILMGGAPMPPALMARLEERLGVAVQTSWGMTELSPLGAMSSPCDSERTASVSGRPSVGIDMLLTDASGKALAQQRNVEGHLRVRGCSVVERYLGDDKSATDADGWFDTGDLARIDDRGNLMITGRAKELIKSGGEWINPAEIEAIISALPQVSLAAVIARPDEKWGERPVLLVEMRKNQTISDDDLRASLRGRVASWWIPDVVVRVPSMPRASTGKIDKLRLRSEYGIA
jgi:fatty-acyl-CoA synthase